MSKGFAVWRFFAPFLCLPVIWGCGGSPGSSVSSSSSGGSGVGVDGTVSVPSSSSVSLRKNLPWILPRVLTRQPREIMHLGNLAEFSPFRGAKAVVADAVFPVLAKAVVETPTGGSVLMYNSSGTLVGSVTINASTGTYSTTVDPALLGSDKSVYVKITTSGNAELTDIIDLNGKGSGDSVTVTNDLVNTLRTQQALESCGAAFNVGDNLSACISSAPRKFTAMYKVFSGMGGTPGVSDSAGVQAAFESMVKSAFAGRVTPLTLTEIRAVAQGNSSTISDLKTYDATVSAFSAATMASMGPEIVTGVGGICDDTTTLAKYDSVGGTAFTKLANLMKGQQLADLQKITSGGGSFKTMIASYMDDAIAGSTTALDQFDKPNFGRTMMGLATGVTTAELTSGILSGLKTQFSAFNTWIGIDPAQRAAAFKNLIKSSGSTAEIEQWGNVDLETQEAKYAGASGQDLLDGQFKYQVNNGGTATSLPCATNSDCASGKTCALNLFQCVDETNSGSGLALGAVCTTDDQCATGNCAASGFCDFPSGIDPLAKQWLLDGATCTAAADCLSNVCSGGTCGAQVLSTPSGCSATAGNSGAITFTCNAVTLATGYKIYRSTTSGFTVGADTLISSPATPTLAMTGLNNASTYYLRMAAVDANTNVTSTATAEFNSAPGQLSAVTNPAASAAYQSCAISWTSTACTGSGGVDLWVHRDTTSGFTAAVGNRVATIDDATTTLYANTGLTNGTAYYYRVNCVDADAVNTSVAAQVACTPAVPVPTNFSCSDGGSGNANCTWTAISGVSTPTYRVYHDTTSPVSTSDTSATTTSTSLNITGLSNGTNYFRIRAEKAGDNSALSSEVSAVVTGAITYKMIYVTAAHNTDFKTGFGTGIAGADDFCMNDGNYPGSGTYKALIVDGTNRVACTTSDCGGGPGEHTDWVLAADTEYRRTDGTTVIDTTDSNGLFTFDLDNAISGGISSDVLTGMDSTWVNTSSIDCDDWVATGLSSYNRGLSDGINGTAINAGSLTCSAMDVGILYCVEQ